VNNASINTRELSGDEMSAADANFFLSAEKSNWSEFSERDKIWFA
jgi:hypothetical protein